MKLLPLLATTALVVLAAPVVAVAGSTGGTVSVTSGNVVAARPVGAQPALVMVRPGFVQVPVAVGQNFALTQPLVIARPLAVTQPVVVTQPPIIIGQPFMITQPALVQQQIVLPQSGLFFTSQGATLVVR